MDTDVNDAFQTVFDDHEHDTATFDIESPEGDFVLQYTTKRGGGYLWNICAEPPRGAPDRYETVSESRRPTVSGLLTFDEPTVLVSVTTDGIDHTPEGARVEFDEIVAHVGGDDATVASADTYRVGTGDLREDVAYLFARAKERVASTLGVTA